MDNKTIIQSEENREIGLNAQNTHDNNGEEAKVNEEEAKDNKEDVKEIPSGLLKGIKIKYINNYLELFERN